MATTKYKIAEGVLRLLKGHPTISSRVQMADIMILVEQIANKVLKAEYFGVNLPEGDTIPPNCAVFTYEDIPVTTYKTTLSKASLPSIPLNLPRNLGVLHISKTDDINAPFIPIPSSIYGVIKPQTLLGDLSGLIGYEVIGKDVVFTKDLPGLGINSVYMRLVGVDLSQLSDYDILPLSADLEAIVVGEIYKMLITVPTADRVADSND